MTEMISYQGFVVMQGTPTNSPGLRRPAVDGLGFEGLDVNLSPRHFRRKGLNFLFWDGHVAMAPTFRDTYYRFGEAGDPADSLLYLNYGL